MPTSHLDTFAFDHLPPAAQQPDYFFDLPELQFPAQLNCATEILDAHIARGGGADICIRAPGGLCWTYADLQEQANRIANFLRNEWGLVPGNRVLLRAPNNPMLAACWFAVIKLGAIAVATMPLFRAKELQTVIEKAQIRHALCDAKLADEMALAQAACPALQQLAYFNLEQVTGTEQSAQSSQHLASAIDLQAAIKAQPSSFENCATASDDTCILAFTSGTTGIPKATMHFHRDVMAICACWPRHVLRPEASDVFIGSPPLAFTFGLGGLLLFPMAVGASTVLLEKATPPLLLDAILEFGATILFTAPTSYRALASYSEQLRTSKLRKCVSAGEALPAVTRAQWKAASGIEMIDGIGATEMLHIFISADEQHAKPGATGTVVPGYRAKIIDEVGQEVAVGTVGRLAVQGPTGCRYLDDARQQSYVLDGWNLTGDAYLMDADGYFFYQARTDDMIISAGYNIAAPEVEEALMLHAAVAECAVIGVDDEGRGQIVKAFVVLREGQVADAAMVKSLQDFVKQSIAPYKYPRAVQFIDKLPRTQTGKLQRFRLK